MEDGLWHRVLKEKYFPFVSIHRWLHTVDIHKVRGSQIWTYLLKSIHLLLHWIVWSPKDGKSIVIGKDRILGLGDAALLSEELLAAINRKGIFFLYQVQKEAQVGRITQNWFSSTDLELTGHLHEEWSLFRRALINGVFLQANPDLLKWSGGNSTGLITVKNVYLAAATLKWNNNFGGWRMAMWKWNVP
jgi:hypothetical protein